jgi:hypothetical protein
MAESDSHNNEEITNEFEKAFNVIEDPTVKTEFQEAFQELDRLEIIQLLSDLEYIPLKAFDDGFIDDDEMAKAVQQFRLDLSTADASKDLSNLHEIVLESKVIEQDELKEGELSPREVYILKEITGLDEELIIRDVPENETSLLSRILIFRYNVFDLLGTTEITPSQKLTSELITTLKDEGKSIGFVEDETKQEKSWIQLANLLANQYQLSLFCKTSEVLSNKISGDCIFISVEDEGKAILRELGKKIKKEDLFLETIATSQSRRYVRNLMNRSSSSNFKKQVAKTFVWPSNIFMRRMLQVKLWMAGLYHGELDDYFGPKSVEALSDFLMTIIEMNKDGRTELGRIMNNLGQGQCVININYLLTNYFIRMENDEMSGEQSSVSQVFNFVLEKKTPQGNFKPQHVEKVQKESEKLGSALQSELRDESQVILQKKRRNVRQYKAKKGIGKFFSEAFKFVKNLITKLKRLIQKLFRIIKKVAKFIYNEIKEAFQTFARGLKFLFGKRIIDPTPHIVTDYDIDFDGITKIKGTPTQQEIETHIATLKSYSSAIYPTLTFVKNVIKWGLQVTSSPIGWVKILVGIAKIFKDMVFKKKNVLLLNA